MNEGSIFRILNGPFKDRLFQISFGHKRWFRTMEDYFALHTSIKFEDINDEQASDFPMGPPMPRSGLPDFEVLLRQSVNHDDIREAMCRGFYGSGIELGAGNRPTIVPDGCRVTYIDKFSFAEAADGSFVGKKNENFVRIDHKSEMSNMPDIEPRSLDFAIACHVIEHVPDVIAAIREALSKLKVGAPLALVVPHRDHMFDRDRPITSLHHFVSDSIQNPPPMLEHYLEYARLSKRDLSWIDVGQAMMRKGSDFHPHTFTPSSMSELLHYMKDAGELAQFSVFEPEHAAELWEFYVILSA